MAISLLSFLISNQYSVPRDLPQSAILDLKFKTMGVPKLPRTVYFKHNPWVKEIRNCMGHEAFDMRYRAIYKFVSKLYPGQFFFVRDLCKHDPDNHELVVRLIDIFYHMAFLRTWTMMKIPTR